MAFSSKDDAISKLTTSIVNPSDPQLQPAIGVAIESTNLQAYIQNLLDWIFPPDTALPLIDLRGKVLGVSRPPSAPNTVSPIISNYSNLEMMTMMPLGGMIMFPFNGYNTTIDANTNRSIIVPNSPLPLPSPPVVLDGFLFLDGSTIDITKSGNTIFNDLKMMFVANGMFGNVITDNLLRLPDMRGLTPIGFDRTSPSSPISNPLVNANNYGQVGNVGGTTNVILGINQLPSHSHASGTLSAIAGVENNHQHYMHNNGTIYAAGGDGGLMASPSSGSADTTFSTALDKASYQGQHTHTISGNTANTGSTQGHENRMPYMVVNYAIKY